MNLGFRTCWFYKRSGKEHGTGAKGGGKGSDYRYFYQP